MPQEDVITKILRRKRLILVIGASAAGIFETGAVASAIVLVFGLLGLLITARDRPDEIGLHAIPAAIAIGIVTGTAYISLEALLFWPGLPAPLRSVTPAPFAPRLAFFIVAACQDEVVWRLFVLSLALFLMTRRRAEDRPSASTAAAVVLSATLYVGFHLPFVITRVPLTPFLAVRELALHFTTPIVWGVVYCRRGLAASMAAHAAAHLPIQLGITLIPA